MSRSVVAAAIASRMAAIPGYCGTDLVNCDQTAIPSLNSPRRNAAAPRRSGSTVMSTGVSRASAGFGSIGSGVCREIRSDCRRRITPVLTIPLEADSGETVAIPHGLFFSTAICVAVTTGVADADTGAPGANDVVINIGYK